MTSQIQRARDASRGLFVLLETENAVPAFDDLHPDLQPFLSGNELKHPVVEWPYAFPAFYRRLNQCYLHKCQLLSGEKQPNDWDKFYPHLNILDRLKRYTSELFADHVPHDSRFSGERLAFFGQCWTSPDLIAQTSSFCEMMTDSPFSRDISGVMTSEEIAEWRALPEVLDIYRASRRGLELGCCWYPDPSVAAAWATIPYNEVFSTARIQRDDVRALFNRRGEVELIVQMSKITNVCTVSRNEIRT